MENNSSQKQNLKITDRKNLIVDGVIDVKGFDESYVSIVTELGALIIEGSSLKIESLGKEEGVISIKGNINGVFYNDNTEKKHFKLFK